MSPLRPRCAGRSAPTVLAALVIVLAALAAACGPARPSARSRPTARGPRALTLDKADELALVRSADEQAGVRAVTITVPGPAGQVIRGWVDFAHQVGYGTVSAANAPRARGGLISWNLRVVGSRPLDGPRAPVPMPTQGWQVVPLDPAASARDAVLAVLLNLAASRPDNAELLAQSDARWLRRDHVGTEPVDVIAGPGSDAPGGGRDPASRRRRGDVRYWVATGGVLRRVQVRAGTDGAWCQVDLGPARSVHLVASP